jgi:hypothetical protein
MAQQKIIDLLHDGWTVHPAHFDRRCCDAPEVGAYAHKNEGDVCVGTTRVSQIAIRKLLADGAVEVVQRGGKPVLRFTRRAAP